MDTVMSVSGQQDALVAVVGLLRSLGLNNTNEVIAAAARLAASGPAGDDTDDVRRLAIARLGGWFGRQLGQPDLDPEHAFLVGRAAFVEIDAANRWPGVLLAETAPADFAEALTKQAPRACPIVPATAMAAQALEAPSPFSPLVWLIRGLLAGGARTA
jgi:hypothetical protein